MQAIITLQSSDESQEGSEDIDATLQTQLDKLKSQRSKEQFKILNCGVNHIVFMKTELEDHARLVYTILGTMNTLHAM